MFRTLTRQVPTGASAQTRPRVGRVLRTIPLVILLGLLMIPAFIAEDSSTRWFFGLSELAFLSCAGYLVLGWSAQRDGSVRFGVTGPLTFTPAPAAKILLLLAPIFIGIAGVIRVLSWAQPSAAPGFGMLGTVIYLAIGVLGTAAVVIGYVRPAGLELSAEGIRWRRTFRVSNVSWEELIAAETPPAGSPKLLLLRAQGGIVHRVFPLAFGSDPAAVAAVVNHYLGDESAREVLNAPERAIDNIARQG